MSEEFPEEIPENDFYKHLRDSENKLESEINALPEDEVGNRQAITEHLRSILTEVLTTLRSEREPDRVFAAAMRGLTKIQQEQFILENILEAIKRGEDLTDIMNRFERLGLLPEGVAASGAQTNQETGETPATDPGRDQGEIAGQDGGFFMGVRKKLGRSSMLLANVALNAARAAGKFVEVVPVIGFTGPFPTVSLQLQPKGASLDDLFEVVMDILEQSRDRHGG